MSPDVKSKVNNRFRGQGPLAAYYTLLPELGLTKKRGYVF